MVFLEFVLEIYVNMDECEDTIVMSAVNIIERAEFEIKSPCLFTYQNSKCLLMLWNNIYSTLNDFIV